MSEFRLSLSIRDPLFENLRLGLTRQKVTLVLIQRT